MSSAWSQNPSPGNTKPASSLQHFFLRFAPLSATTGNLAFSFPSSLPNLIYSHSIPQQRCNRCSSKVNWHMKDLLSIIHHVREHKESGRNRSCVNVINVFSTSICMTQGVLGSLWGARVEYQRGMRGWWENLDWMLSLSHTCLLTTELPAMPYI